MINRFSLYDFIAVVIPGVFFLWAVGTFADVFAQSKVVPLSGGVAETSVLVVVGYVTGLLLQGISQHILEGMLLWWWGGFPSARWLLPDDRRFTMSYKDEIAAAVLKKFGIVLDLKAGETDRDARLKRNQEIFRRCYRAIDKLSELPQTFNAQYGLFRCLLATFVLLGIISGVRIAWLHYAQSTIDITMLGFCFTCLLGITISYWRVRKRGEDFALCVYDLFLANFGNPQ